MRRPAPELAAGPVRDYDRECEISIFVLFLSTEDPEGAESGRFAMSDKSQIEWTEATWNPVTGCTQVSPGCAHCYALTFAERFRGVPGHPYEGGFDLTLRPARLDQPLTWK